MMQVIKRDGKTIEEFDDNKIRTAIMKAVEGSHSKEELKERFDESKLNDLIAKIWLDIVLQCNKSELMDDRVAIEVEKIQDIVERNLIKAGFADTAKAYILYRRKRDEIRSTRDSISKTISDVLMSDSKNCDTKRENGNVNGDTPMGTMLQVGSNVTKNFYVNNMMSKDIAKAYTEGYIHIHDLDFYSTTLTCCQIDFKKLAEGGFNTGHGHLREPQSIGSYATLAAIAIQSNQNDMFGGQSIPNFDYSMTPGIYKSFRKAWNKNITKFKNFTRAITQSDAVDKLKYADNFTDKLIEDILGFKSPSPSYCVMDKDDGFDIKCMYDILILATLDDIERECYQAMEGFVHNLNTLHSRAGAQVK